MEKLNTAKVAELLTDASQALKAVTEERDKLAAENAAMKTRHESEKLAAAMHDKGLRLDVERAELATELEKEAAEGRLPVIQEAVDMVGPNMGLTATPTSDDAPVGGATALEQFIIGNVG
jgi:hypothetical protein